MKRSRIARAALVALGWVACVIAIAAPVQDLTRQSAGFDSGALRLNGILFKPPGAGPFPALLWNHGSERNPGGGAQFDAVAAAFVPAGYVVFAPVRRGHGYSQGKNIVEQQSEARRAQGDDAAQRLAVELLETEQLDDQLAGLAHLRTMAFVDPQRIAVAGCSYGGIQALLAAERGAGYRAAISISPAALSWEGNRYLRERLLAAVARIDLPVMLIQPAKDASLEPSRVLGAEFARLRKPFSGKVYPASGPQREQTHCFGGARGTQVWARDALVFLRGVLK